MEKRRVLIVDNHEIVRRGLMQLAREDGGFDVDEAASAREALERIATAHYDVIVLDVTMPEQNGLEVLPEILALRPDVPVLVLSVHDEEQFAVQALRLGAKGYLNKNAAVKELSVAIAQLCAGRTYVSARLAEYLARQLGTAGGSLPHEQLSPKQRQVFDELITGASATVVANNLKLSVKTVCAHRKRILQKLNLSDNASLLRYAMRYGLLKIDSPDR